MTGKRDYGDLQLLLLHALPLDGGMWSEQAALLPGATHTPTLYDLGDDMDLWARTLLAHLPAGRLIVVGCSVGGSCALQMAHIAPERIAALVLIGTKAGHDPDPQLRQSALTLLRQGEMQSAWDRYWGPLFSPRTGSDTIETAWRMACRQGSELIAKGVNAFHTRPDRSDVIADFPGEISIVSGADDRAPGTETSRKQTDAARFGRFHLLPDCGHYVPIEQPEAINAIIAGVIDRHLQRGG